MNHRTTSIRKCNPIDNNKAKIIWLTQKNKYLLDINDLPNNDLKKNIIDIIKVTSSKII